jgi:DNA (cytosine-5)-methyltransferase 1
MIEAKESNKLIPFISLFAGIEAPRVALEPLGFRCVWENELDSKCCTLLKQKYGDETLVEGDIRNVDTKTIPNHDLLIAGFPCQPFSQAGHRKGIDEDRGTLFTHIARVARAKRPKLLLLENVKALLSSSSGRDFAIILRVLGELGYILEWQVINSRHFGVPQNRERTYIIGYHGESGFKPVFPIRFPKLLPVEGEEKYNNHCGKTATPTGYTGTILANYGKLSGSSTKIMVEGKKRILTPLECERAQGFPDNYTLGFSDKDRYHMIGNSMTVPVIQFLGLSIKGRYFED